MRSFETEISVYYSYTYIFSPEVYFIILFGLEIKLFLDKLAK